MQKSPTGEKETLARKKEQTGNHWERTAAIYQGCGVGQGCSPEAGWALLPTWRRRRWGVGDREEEMLGRFNKKDMPYRKWSDTKF